MLTHTLQYKLSLSNTTYRAKFQSNYKAYIDLTRDAAKTYNIPLTLDVAGRGIKSHWWVTQNYGGDHVDPYGYLAQMGISKAQLQHDLLYGVGGNTTPSQPSNPTDPRTAGSGYSVMYQPTANYAHVDQWGRTGDTLKARGWHVANYKYQYVFIIDRTTGKELARQKAPGIARVDVNSAYKTSMRHVGITILSRYKALHFLNGLWRAFFVLFQIKILQNYCQ